MHTDMSIVVQLVVGQLELVKGDNLLHPLGSGGRRVRVDVHPGRRHGVSLASDHPRRAAIVPSYCEKLTYLTNFIYFWM